MSDHLLEFEKVDWFPQLSVGDKVVYRKVDRKGYGFVIHVHGVVVSIGKSKTTIGVMTRDGKTKRISVNPRNLTKKDGAK